MKKGDCFVGLKKPALCLVLCFLGKIFLVFFLIASTCEAAEVTLAWDANTEPDLAGYVIHHGKSSRNYDTQIDVGNQTTYTLYGIEESMTHYFAVTAYDFEGNESDYSNEVARGGVPFCQYTVTPLSHHMGSSNGVRFVNVLAPETCSWEAWSGSPWLEITSKTRYSGSVLLAFWVDTNATPSLRTGVLIIAGETVLVVQQGHP